MRWYFGFFFVSGFCSLLYELVWLRLAMARFSVTTALISIVLSAFMVGLGLGSWAAGRYIGGSQAGHRWDGLRLYAFTEQFALVNEFPVDSLIRRTRGNVPALQDDRPVNEYYILRSVRDPDYRRYMWERFLRAIRRI
jgi:hypothetical protein